MGRCRSPLYNNYYYYVAFSQQGLKLAVTKSFTVLNDFSDFACVKSNVERGKCNYFIGKVISAWYQCNIFVCFIMKLECSVHALELLWSDYRKSLPGEFI